MRYPAKSSCIVWIALLVALLATGCRSTYYEAQERLGYSKRDILIARVKAAADAEKEASESIESALATFDIGNRKLDLPQFISAMKQRIAESEQSTERFDRRLRDMKSVASDWFSEQKAEASGAERKKLHSRYMELSEEMESAQQVMSRALDTMRNYIRALNSAAEGAPPQVHPTAALLAPHDAASQKAADSFLERIRQLH